MLPSSNYFPNLSALEGGGGGGVDLWVGKDLIATIAWWSK